MKDTLQVGLIHQHHFHLSDAKMVPALYPESSSFQDMPAVFATGFMVGFLEWACIEAIKPHLDWPHEQSLGTAINVTHEAATPAGFTVTATVKVTEINDRRVRFAVEAHDGVERIAQGTHERFIIDKVRFDQKVARKQASSAN
jgi:fluoroacetyl-CoA thioesterase